MDAPDRELSVCLQLALLSKPDFDLLVFLWIVVTWKLSIDFCSSSLNIRWVLFCSLGLLYKNQAGLAANSEIHSPPKLELKAAPLCLVAPLCLALLCF